MKVYIDDQIISLSEYGFQNLRINGVDLLFMIY